ncbi:MAG: UDP-N-acetylmuramate dehydrogenase [Oscillospiraceae bacterium]|jgi:UDP-N-acetylmuramate dehydrogenase|nr:UDP-N-acetylmuramate dehydrogenase [Oscillospiraceae bacterium]
MDDISVAVAEISKKLPELEYRRSELLSGHTSLRIGGPVTAMFFPKSAHELETLRSLLRDRGVAPIVMGNGTNILADGRGFDAIAIKTTGLSGLETTPDGSIRAGAGVTLRRLAAFARDNGLRGLEFAHGIPGTLGGAVVMNAGAYGGQMSDAVAAVRYLPRFDGATTAAEAEEAGAAECGFGYRRSRFSDGGEVVVSADIRLERADAGEITARMEELAARRRASQPLDLPSAGSAFKRPRDGYAAELIERAGLKGHSVGGARVSEKHAGFIVNAADATFDDDLRLIEYVRVRVLTLFGVALEPEIKILRRDLNGGAQSWKF